MKKLLVIITLSVVVLGAVFALVFLTQYGNKQTSVTSEKVTNEKVQRNKSTSEMSSQYVDYSSDIVANTKGRKVLFFHAPWCPQCRALDASIRSGSIPKDVTIIKTDYDSNQGLRQKYGVTIQTTLVEIDDNGNLVKKYVAYDEPTLAAVISNLL